MTSVLPDKPSDLILLALGDLEKAEKNPRYNVNMNTWHLPAASGKYCCVCFAGAVMAYSLGACLDYDLSPADFPEESKLLALDSFRQGEVLAGVCMMYSEGVSRLPQEWRERGYISISTYAGNNEKFKIDMRNIAKVLAEHGC